MRLARIPIAFVLTAVVHAATAGAADQVIFVVRHAEQAAATDPGAQKRMMADDPPLTPAGQQRAERLAALLAASGIQHIYTTEFLRTRQTASALAAKLKLKPVMAAAKDPDPLIAQIRKTSGNVLVVSHATTIPDLLKKLGVTDPVTIGDSDYGDLLIVVRPATGPPTLVKLRY